MTDTSETINIDGLPTTSELIVVRYGKTRYIVTASEGFGALRRIRSLIRDDETDVVPLAHRDGLVWLTVGPGIPISFDEIEADQDKSQKATLKKRGI